MRTGLSFLSSRQPSPTRRRGWTLVEMVVALGTGTIVLASILVTGVVVTNTMTALGNYYDLNQASRNALDTMTKDLRNTATVVGFSTTSLTVSNVLTGDLATYSWDGTNDFTRNFDGTRTVLLTGCDTLTFAGYQRNPTNDFQFVTNSAPSQIKLVSVSWRCSRQIFGVKINTESVQTAKICIRN